MKALIVVITIFVALHTALYAEVSGPGARGVFTRGGFVGAENVAAGGAVEATTDDLFAIYWNPSGLLRLYNKKINNPSDITKKADKDQLDDITEEDLRKMSEDTSPPFFNFGASASMLDVDRRAAFSGAAFKFFSGVMGVGAYVINSPDIQKRDSSGNPIGTASYTASAAYLSYAFNAWDSSLGITVKGLSETIDADTYYGTSLDIGVQNEVLPLVRMGFVVQDAVLVFFGGSLDGKSHEFGKPVVRGSVAVDSRARDMTISVSLVKKVESDDYEVNGGVRYILTENLSVLGGIKKRKFTCGSVIRISGFDLGYALAIDPIRSGYNNTVSLSAVF